MDGEFVNISNDAERISLVRIVAEAASNQAKVTNRLWLAVIANTVIVFLPMTPGANDGAPTVQLPFGLGAVPPTAFYPVVFAILSILAVALAAAHAQQMRADKFAHHVVTELTSAPAGSPARVSLHLRDLLDILRHPSITRVAPLAQVITGHYHSQIKSDSPSTDGTQSRAWIFTGFYLLLKLFALVVLFVIPMAGLMVAYRKVATALDGWLLYVLGLTGLLAILSLLIAAIADSISVVRLATKLRHKAH